MGLSRDQERARRYGHQPRATRSGLGSNRSQREIAEALAMAQPAAAADAVGGAAVAAERGTLGAADGSVLA